MKSRMKMKITNKICSQTSFFFIFLFLAPFLQFLTNVRQLGFTEDPDYPTLLSYWTDYADSQGMKLESYDWESSVKTIEKKKASKHFFVLIFSIFFFLVFYTS